MGKGKKPKAPTAPNYNALADKQAALTNQQVQQNTVANRADQVNPFGSLKWSQDPATGAWTQTTSLSPQQQAALDSAQGIQTSAMGDLAGQGAWGGGPAMPEYDQNSGEAHGKRLAEMLMARVRPQQEQSEAQMQTKLRLQGLQPGTQAYDRAYKNMLTSHGDVNSQSQLQGMLAGAQEARDIYNTQLGGQSQGYQQSMQDYLMPWQRASMAQGLVGGVQQPNFANYNQAAMGKAPDILGASQSTYENQMQRYNEQMQQRQGKGGSIGSLVGAGAGMFMGIPPSVGASVGGSLGSSFSDAALKEDIEEISDAVAYNAMLNIHPYSFVWPSGRRAAGLVAQEVQAILPHLVHEAEQGFLKVDYEGFTALLLGAFRHLATKEQENGVL